MLTPHTERLLTAPSCERPVIHFEVDISGSGMRYTAGDAIGITPQASRVFYSWPGVLLLSRVCSFWGLSAACSSSATIV